MGALPLSEELTGWGEKKVGGVGGGKWEETGIGMENKIILFKK